MSVILTKVIRTDRYEIRKPNTPQLAYFSCGVYSLYLPNNANITARMRLILEYIRRGYRLKSIGYKACFASFTK